jgi:type I site-specific restriction-modification system R (restriction) subunit
VNAWRTPIGGNLRDYRDTIPQIFWYNAFIILSNGHESRIGSMTAGWEHFFEWKKIRSEDEKGAISLETMIRGTCEKSRLLDIVENFTLFNDAGGALVKLLARNHQYNWLIRFLADERCDRMKRRCISSSQTRSEPCQRRVLLFERIRPIVPHPPPA